MLKSPGPGRGPRKKTTKVRQALNRAKREGWLHLIRTPADEIAASNGYFVDRARLDQLAAFWDQYAVLTEGNYAGKPFVRLDWQRELTESAFGWVFESPEYGRLIRRFKYVFAEIPKKNGKTPLIANIANFLFLVDSYQKQINVGCTAFNRRQAERLLKHAFRAIKEKRDLKNQIIDRRTDGFLHLTYGENEMECLSGTPEAVDGYNGSIIYDEIHRARGDKLWLALRYAIASNPDAMFLGITTAGDSTESVAWGMRKKTLAIERGDDLDLTWCGRVYAIRDDDDPADESAWKRANPSLGETDEYPLKLSQFRSDFQDALKSGPSEYRNFLRLRLGRWAYGTNTWVDMQSWDAGEAGRAEGIKDCFEDFDPYKLQQERPYCVAGLDFGAVRDTTACSIIGEYPDRPGVYFDFTYFWLPMDRALELDGRVPFLDWADNPKCNLKLTPGNVVDFATVEADLLEIFSKWNIARFYYDPLFQSLRTAQMLADEGYEDISFNQSRANYSPCMKTAERWIASQSIVHNGNPLLSYQLGNLDVDDSNGEVRPVKPKHNSESIRQIDGWTSKFQAIMEFVQNDPETGYQGAEIW